MLCVNLLRWSLKPSAIASASFSPSCKFTPLEFETTGDKLLYLNTSQCKFTPLEFETQNHAPWEFQSLCKFTPLEFETQSPHTQTPDSHWCKFTPLEFETFKTIVNITRYK